MISASASSEHLYFTEHGSGSPLLLVHGLMVSGEMFETVIDHFSTRHRVIVPDLRGHGRSRGLPPPYAAAQLASDLSRLLDRLGINSTAVFGYSQGGAIAQQLVLDDPTRCDRLALACTYAFNMATFRERLEGRVVPLLVNVLGLKRFSKLIFSQGLTHLDKDRADRLARVMGGQNRKLMVKAWREMMAFDSRHRLAEIKCPTLVVAGSDDEAVPIHHAKMLRDGIAGARLVIIDGANHALIWTHADELVRVVDAFLDA